MIFHKIIFIFFCSFLWSPQICPRLHCHLYLNECKIPFSFLCHSTPLLNPAAYPRNTPFHTQRSRQYLHSLIPHNQSAFPYRFMCVIIQTNMDQILRFLFCYICHTSHMHKHCSISIQTIHPFFL